MTSSHFFTSGPSNELEEFLKTHSRILVSVFHPFYHSPLRHSWATYYKEGKQERRIVFATLPQFGIVNYMRDFLFSFWIAISLKKKFNLFVGSNPLNALTGICLRRLGFVERVVFYKIDFVPNRFGNHILNHIYQSVDRVCLKKSDWTWNLAGAMISRTPAKDGQERNLLVPIGSNFDRIERLPLEKVQRNKIVYLGSLREGQGLRLIVDAFSEIRKVTPDAELLIIGSGPLEQSLKERVTILGLESSVTFTGLIQDHRDVEKLLTNCAIGLAPYEPIQKGFTKYTEPGKVKVYMACGLPVIITKVPEIANEIERRGAGQTISYTIDGLVNAIMSLCEDDAAYEKSREAAIAFAAEFSWNSVFTNAFRNMFKIVQA